MLNGSDANSVRAGRRVLSGFVGTLFFGVFLLLGLFFLFMIGREVLRTAETYSWPSASALILESEVVEDRKAEDPYSVRVRYSYRWDGVEQVSEQVQRPKERFSDYADAAEVVAAYRPGATAVCFVNSKEPEAVLRHGSLWMGFFVLIPVVFIAVGGIGIASCWGLRSSGKKKAASDEGAARGNGHWVGLLFVGVGLALLVFWYLPTMARGVASLSWSETPCTIESSRVVEVDSDDGTTYRVDILYRYVFNGVEYRSNRYKAFKSSSSGRAEKQAVVNRHPPGSTAVCYVNPAAPGDVVLVRGVGWDAAWGLVPLVFAGFGMVFFFIGRRRSRNAKPVVTSWDAGLAETRELKPRTSPVARLMFLVLFGLFWNGFVAFFVRQVLSEWARGEQPVFLSFFLIPFVLVGLGLVAAIVYSLMAMTNPRPFVRMTPGVLVPGCAFDVSWQMGGPIGRLRGLSVFLEGREEATYRRGTDSHTDRHVFARFLVAELGSAMEMAEGTARRTLPADVLPGFQSQNNKILWSLRVHGKISHWPDLNEEFEVEVANRSQR